MAQDSKYGKIDIPGVPDDMPVFVILAKDRVAVMAVEEYGACAYHIGASPVFLEGVRNRASEIADWQTDNQDKVKIPD